MATGVLGRAGAASVRMTGDAVATLPHQEIEVRPLMGLLHVVDIEPDPSPLDSGVGGDPPLAPLGQRLLVDQELESSTPGIEMDPITAPDEGQGTSDSR